MFILDKRILERPGKDGWREAASAGFEFQEQGRFTIIQGNKMFYEETAGQLKALGVSQIGTFSDECLPGGMDWN